MQRYKDILFTDAQIKKEPDMVFSTTYGLKCDGYHPMNDIEKSRPCVIWGHAGGGKKDDLQPVKDVMQFVYRGYVGISYDYRNESGESMTEEDQKMALSDCLALVRWVRTNATKLGVNPDKIFVGGRSAGSMTGIEANISANNLEDTYFKDDTKVNVDNAGFSSTVIASATVTGCASGKIQDFIDSSDAPNYFYAGTEDKSFPIDKVQKCYDAMITVGIPSTIMIFEGAPHKIGHFDEIMGDITSKFFNLI